MSKVSLDICIWVVAIVLALAPSGYAADVNSVTKDSSADENNRAYVDDFKVDVVYDRGSEDSPSTDDNPKLKSKHRKSRNRSLHHIKRKGYNNPESFDRSLTDMKNRPTGVNIPAPDNTYNQSALSGTVTPESSSFKPLAVVLLFLCGSVTIIYICYKKLESMLLVTFGYARWKSRKKQ